MSSSPVTKVKPIVGPDLNKTKPEHDPREYRLVTLANGLECLLIHQELPAGVHDDESSDEEDDDENDDENDPEDDDQATSDTEDEDDEGEAGGTRHSRAAAAVGVNCGSFLDPESCQGLAHFLEHMLFMGSEKYPQENAFDSLLAKYGGSSNAYTDSECTVYHCYCPPNKLAEVVDVFANFFTSPLMLTGSVSRELKSIESEFELAHNSDGNRVCEIWSLSAQPEHPMSKFSWGCTKSLREDPESKGVDVMKELRTFFDRHYFARNMRLVMISTDSLDQLESMAIESFSNIPSDPRLPHPDSPSVVDPFVRPSATLLGGAKNETDFVPLDTHVDKVALECIFRITPVSDKHKLSLVFPLPSVIEHYRSKPEQYLGHLIGHESAGSIYSVLQAREWASGLVAGVSAGGLDSSTRCSMFYITVNLMERGLQNWKEVIHLILGYLAMLEAEGPQQWIFDEQKRIEEIEYKYMPPGEADDDAEELADRILPYQGLEPTDYLTGPHLTSEWKPNLVTDMLQRLVVSNMRIDLLSSAFKTVEQQDNDTTEDLEQVRVAVDGVKIAQSIDIPQELIPNRDPLVEPWFGTKFWHDALPQSYLNEWKTTRSGKSEKKYHGMFHLPRHNPYMVSEFSLRDLPATSASHPLLGAAVKVRTQVGKRLEWLPGTVVQFDETKRSILVDYQGDESRWHKLPEQVQGLNNFELDGNLRCTVLSNVNWSSALQGSAGKVDASFGEVGEENDVWANFPAIPPHVASMEPVKSKHSDSITTIWHLQDRLFRVPKAYVLMLFTSGMECKSRLSIVRKCVMSDLLLKLVDYVALDDGYYAKSSQFDYAFETTDRQEIQVRASGFSEKILVLLANLFAALFGSFNVESKVVEECESKMKKLLGCERGGPRFGNSVFSLSRVESEVEHLKRNYRNKNSKASQFANATRLACLFPDYVTSKERVEYVESMPSQPENWLRELLSFTCEFFALLDIQCLAHGNLDDNDVKRFAELLQVYLKAIQSKPMKTVPHQQVSKLAPLNQCVPREVRVPTKLETDKNNSVTIYYQIDEGDIHTRVKVDLIGQIMYEMLYDQLRTQEQLGYSVSCAARFTAGVVGFVIRVTSASHTADFVVSRIEEFLRTFQAKLVALTEEEYANFVCGLACSLMETDTSMRGECNRHANQILSHQYAWNDYLDEATALKSVTHQDVVKEFERSFATTSTDKRCLVVVVEANSSSDDVVEGERCTAHKDNIVLPSPEAFHDEHVKRGGEYYSRC